MTKTAKLLFGLCDFHCMRETNKNLDQIKGTKEFKEKEKQFKIVDLAQRKEALILEEHAVTLERIRTAAKGALKGFQIVNNFIFINILLEQYSMKMDTIGEIVQAAKTGQIHPSLLSPSELLEQFKDITFVFPLLYFIS
jgi:hypothetical protein